MASLRSVLFFALAAVAVQSAAGWTISMPGPLGSSGSLASLAGSNTGGMGIALNDDGFSGSLQFGPMGGLQARIVNPVLPSMSALMNGAEENMGQMYNNIGSLMTNAMDNGLGLLGMSASNIDGINSNISGMMNNAGSLLGAAVRYGMLSFNQAMAGANAMMRSALQQTLNPLARFMDVLQWAVQQKLMAERQAAQMVASAMNNGLQMAGNMNDASLAAFMEASANAENISNEVTQRLKNYILSPLQSSDSSSSSLNGVSTATTVSSSSSTGTGSGSNGGASLTVSTDTNGDSVPDVSVGISI